MSNGWEVDYLVGRLGHRVGEPGGETLSGRKQITGKPHKSAHDEL